MAPVVLSLIFIAYGYLAITCPGFSITGATHGKDHDLSLQPGRHPEPPDPLIGSLHLLFVLFGAFVEASGAGKFFVDFARCAAGRLRGGPAKVSIISSAIIGTASGSSWPTWWWTGSLIFPDEGKRFQGDHIRGHRGDDFNRRPDHASGHGAGAFLMAEILGVLIRRSPWLRSFPLFFTTRLLTG